MSSHASKFRIHEVLTSQDFKKILSKIRTGAACCLSEVFSRIDFRYRNNILTGEMRRQITSDIWYRLILNSYSKGHTKYIWWCHWCNWKFTVTVKVKLFVPWSCSNYYILKSFFLLLHSIFLHQSVTVHCGVNPMWPRFRVK